MRSHCSTPPTLILNSTPISNDSLREEEDNDAFLTPQDEKDLAAGILCVRSGGKGKGRIGQHRGNASSIIPKASVSFSPHLRTHPYNPTLRVSTSLKPLPSQQYHLSPSPHPSRAEGLRTSSDRALQEMEPIPQTPGSSTSPCSTSSFIRGHPKSILKSRPDQRIRVARTVELGTKRNCDDAKLSLGVGGSGGSSSSSSSGGGGGGGGGGESGESNGVSGPRNQLGNRITQADEEEPQDPEPSIFNLDVREESSVDSLLDIIIGQGSNHDAFDLVSIGEAYDTLLVKLRKVLQTKPMGMGGDDDCGEEDNEELEEWKRVIKSIKIRIEGLLKAFKRDIGSVVGTEISARPFNDALSSPSAPSTHIRPPTILPDTPPPQPSPSNIFESPIKPLKKGYTAAEIQYRRAQANAGQECLKFLAFVFYRQEVFDCFTNADLLVLLQSVLLIPNTLKLHTPNPKKSYALAVYALTHLKVPVECVLPLKEQILRALSSAVGEIATRHWGGGPGKKEGEGGNVRARVEGFSVTQQILTEYPEVFALEHGVLLPLILKGLCNPIVNVRIKATGSLGALIRGRMSWADKVGEELKDLLGMEVEEDERDAFDRRQSELRADLLRIRKGTKECEVAATRLLFEKQIFRIPGSPLPPTSRRLWDRIARFMTESMKTSPQWSCSTWASLVTLMGDGYMQQENCREINLTVLQLVHDFKKDPSAIHPQFCRMAWDHAIYCAIKQNSVFDLDNSIPVVRYQPKSWYKQPASEVIYVTILAVKKLLEHGEKLGYTTWEEGQAVDLATLRNCLGSLESVVYGLSGAIQRTILPKTTPDPQEHKSDLAEVELHAVLFDKLYQETLGPVLVAMLSVHGLDEVRIKAWDVLSAITASSQDTKLASWNLDRLLHPAFFGSDSPTGASEESLTQLAAMHSQGHRLATSEVPGWGAYWIARAFAGQLLPTFEKALYGLHAMEDKGTSIEWVESAEGVPLIPVQLSGIWANMMSGLATSGLPDHAVLFGAIAGITHFLGNIVGPHGPRFRAGKTDSDPQQLSSLRLSLMSHLLDIAISALGNSAFANGIPTLSTTPSPNHRNAASPSRNLGLSTGLTSAVTFIFHRLRIAYEAVSQPSAAFSAQYLNSCKRLVLINLDGNDSTRYENLVKALLGWQDTASAVELWLLIGDDLVSLQPFARSTNEFMNAAQAVIVLLTIPFRFGSAWWTSSLSCSAEQIESNCTNVFEALFDVDDDLPALEMLELLARNLAAQFVQPNLPPHMLDFLVSATDITLWRLEPVQGRVVTRVPADFLRLANSLLCCMERTEPTALHLLEQCVEIVGRAEVSLLPALLASLHEGLVQWLTPSEDGLFAEKLNLIYIKVLDRMSQAMRFGYMPIDSENLARYADLFALRVVSSHEELVIEAFQSFWNSTFGTADDLEYSDELKEFLRSFMEADSQFLVVPGLELLSQPRSSSVDSAAYYADVSREVLDDKNVVETSAPVATTEDSQADVLTFETPAGQTAVKALPAVTQLTSPVKRPFEDPQLSMNKRRASSGRPGVASLEPEEDIVPDSQPSNVSMSPSKSQRSLRKGASGTILGAVGAMGMAMGRIIPGLVWRSPPRDGSLAELPEAEETDLAFSRHGPSSPIPEQSSQKRKLPCSLADADDLSSDGFSQIDDTRTPFTPVRRRNDVSVVIPIRPKRRRIGKDLNMSITSMASVESQASTFASGDSREVTPSVNDESSREVQLLQSKKPSRSRKRRSTSSNPASAARRNTRSVAKVSPVPAVPQVAAEESALGQQRTDDAQAAPLQDSGTAKRSAQERLIALIAEASSLSEVASDMDVLGITDLLDDLESIRGAAMRGLRKHAEDDKLRRNKSVGGL